MEPVDDLIRVALLDAFQQAGCAECAVALAPRRGRGRRAEFAEGRELAARCLRSVGLPTSEVARGPHREPQWPTAVTGSISHSEVMVATVVARVPANAVLTVGIDVESIGGVQPDMHDVLFTAAEMGSLRTLGDEARAERSTVLFSAKEALYKAQFPLTHRFVDYPDVELTVSDELAITVRAAPAGLPACTVSLFACRAGASIITGAVIAVAPPVFH